MDADVLSRLRVATRDAHEQLETRLDILSRIGSGESRRELVERFHGWHGGVEAALSPVLTQVAGLDYAGRRRAGVLEADLAALGGRRQAPAAIPAPTSLPEALGMLYVAEGSTLGGRVIRKRVAAMGLSHEGLGFLDPYGEEVGARWKSFLAVLDRECPAHDPAAMDAAVRGGLTGFTQAQAWLCDPEAVA